MDIDYKSFAEELYVLVKNNMPEDLTELQKVYISEKVKKFSIIAGEAIFNENNKLYNKSWRFMVQIVAEWTFHKGIDIFRAGIPSVHCKGILQNVAFAAYETIKQLADTDVELDKWLFLVEKYVNRFYTEAVIELYEKRLIDEITKENALTESNVDNFFNNK